MRRMTAVPPLLLALLAAVAAPAAADDFSHRDWTEVLERFVDDRGFVDYLGLARQRAALDRYLALLAASSPDAEPSRFPTRGDQLAYWLNAYNAVVVAGVLDRGPHTPSVWGDGLFGLGFFTARRAVLGGTRISLQDLENSIVRRRFGDPRIHAALNCASIGCPRLPRRAFEGATLDRSLEDAMREFVAEPRHCRVDRAAGTVWLSKIFDWFEDDFLAFERAVGSPKPSILGYVNRYRIATDPIPADLDVRFLVYDKRLNRQ